jgi:ubiquinone/menaquinone biosynthesis C-methylase UbiE
VKGHPRGGATDIAPATSGGTIRKARIYDLGCAMLFGLDRRLWRMVLELAEVKPGERVLDVGCGPGRLALAAGALVGPAGEAYGIDAAPEMVEVASRKAARSAGNVHFKVGLIEDMPFEDGRFDLVTNTLVMHHLPEDVKRRGLEEVRRVLKPGGRFVAVDIRSPDKGPHALLAHLFIGHHMGASDIGDTVVLLDAAGFTGTSTGRAPISWFSFARGTSPAIPGD